MIYKTDFIFNHAEKVIDTTIVELDELKLFVYVHYGRKIGRYCSKLGSNSQ